MTFLSTEERNMLLLYDPGTRLGAIDELYNMMSYLMPDEDDLKALAEGLIVKLKTMTDDEYSDFVKEPAPLFPPVDIPDEDSGYGSFGELFYDEVDPDAEIE